MAKRKVTPKRVGMTTFQTRHLRRDLHSKLHIIKAARNGQRRNGDPVVTIDQVLNEVIEKGLEQLAQEDGAIWLTQTSAN